MRFDEPMKRAQSARAGSVATRTGRMASMSWAACAVLLSLAGCSGMFAHKDAPAPDTVAAASATAPSEQTAALTTQTHTLEDKPAQSGANPNSPPSEKPMGAKDGVPAETATAAATVDPAVLSQFEAATGELAAGHLDAAQSAFEALAQTHPELGGVQANLGIVLRRKEQLPEAVKHLQAAVSLNPQQPVFWNQLGVSYRMSGQFTEAKQAYQKAIELDPSYGSAVLNLAILEDLYLWNGADALPLYEKYQGLQREPDPKVAKWIADLKNRLKTQSHEAGAKAAVEERK